MKVLLVSHAFPPVNLIGAVRVGKFAKYLCDAGHEIRVIAATPANMALPLEIPAECVAYVEDRPVDQLFDGALRRWRRIRGGAEAKNAEPGSGGAPSRRLGITWSDTFTRHYYALLRIPDARAGWIAAATAAGHRLIRHWRPDMVIGSSPPHSGLVAASRIARACKAPWVAELRDLWVDNPYYMYPGWRRLVDRVIESRVLGTAAGLVGVTPRWTQTLERRYRQPVACILNGYVEDDFPRERAGPAADDVVTIVYTGNIYAGYRDPSPLFRALALIGSERQRVAVDFYGPHPQEVVPLAAAHAVEDRVFVRQPVAYQQSLALQTTADVLLLLQWNNEKDAGNIPAKFFEYLGAGRPILLIGFPDGDLAGMIRDRRAGIVANDPNAIARQLRDWIALKPRGLAAVDPQARVGLTRDEQNRKYERFLRGLLPPQ
jgi:glycosyltransferase involved in cell wall biosynthesis